MKILLRKSHGQYNKLLLCSRPDVVRAIIRGIVRGFSECRPISSTAHLILAPWIFGWDDPGLAFDVVLHLGTLTGIIAFFRKDFYSMLQGMFSGMTVRKEYAGIEGMVGWYIIIGTIPAGLAGLFLKDQIETVLRSPRIIAVSLIVFG